MLVAAQKKRTNNRQKKGDTRKMLKFIGELIYASEDQNSVFEIDCLYLYKIIKNILKERPEKLNKLINIDVS